MPNAPILTLQIEEQPTRLTLLAAPDLFIRFGLGLRLRVNGAPVSWASSDLVLESTSSKEVDSPQGSFQTTILRYKTPHPGLFLDLHAGLHPNRQLGLFKADLINQSADAVAVNRIILLESQPGEIRLGTAAAAEPVFYGNGWQSWSPSNSYRLGEKQARSRLGFLANPMIQYTGTPITTEVNHFSSDMFALVGDLGTNWGLTAGFLSQAEQFGSLECRLSAEPSLRMWANGDGVTLDPGESIATDWAACGFGLLTDPDPMRPYLTAVSRENQVKKIESPPLGWCSWYHYFTKVTPNDVRQNLQQVAQMRAEVPLDLVQIDDGFQESVGNWLTFNKKFPNGVKPLAQEIRHAGLQPGLWLAPFIVEGKSRLRREHPDWILRDQYKMPINCGFGWGSITTALDVTHPAVQDYVREVIGTAVTDWGYDYLKLDFLYAPAVGGIYANPKLTRAKALREALQLIRDAAGSQTTLLGCGCPLGSGVGIMDLMRISADVGPTWKPEFWGISSIFTREPNMPSARNAIRNILTRTELDGLWWGNDPDCLLVRPDSKLTLPEVESLATAIGITGGALLVSDNLADLPEDRLRIVQNLIPPIPANPHVLDLFEKQMPAKVLKKLSTPAGERWLAAVFNWEDGPAQLSFDPQSWGLGEGVWLAREFWSGKAYLYDGAMNLGQTPPHGCRLLTLQRFDGKPAYLGSDLHFSQAMELNAWQVGPGCLELNIGLGHSIAGNILLYIPGKVTFVAINGLTVDWEAGPLENTISIPITLSADADIHITFNAN